MSKNKSSTEEATERPVQTQAPAKAKGLTKKRGRKDRFTAEANTAKRKAARAETIARRFENHYTHVMNWATRNGIKNSHMLATTKELRAAVRDRRNGATK